MRSPCDDPRDSLGLIGPGSRRDLPGDACPGRMRLLAVRASGREESAEQAAGLEFFEAGLLAVGAAADSFEDSG